MKKSFIDNFLIAGKDEIMSFVTDCGDQMTSLENLTATEKYVKIISKLFNERKTLRHKINKMR